MQRSCLWASFSSQDRTAIVRLELTTIIMISQDTRLIISPKQGNNTKKDSQLNLLNKVQSN